jgi:hypothetical protein
LRKIKCGEETPDCTRCVRSGLRCEWNENTTGHYGTGPQYGSSSDNFFTFSIEDLQTPGVKTEAKSDFVQGEAHQGIQEERCRLIGSIKRKK